MSDKKDKWSSGTYRIVYKNYPTYTWGLYPQQWVYSNQYMMDAIDRALDGMTEFPDAEEIIKKIIS
jgi:hypothetical protein